MKYIQNITKRARILSTDRTNNVKQKKNTVKHKKKERARESSNRNCRVTVCLQFILSLYMLTYALINDGAGVYLTQNIT